MGLVASRDKGFSAMKDVDVRKLVGQLPLDHARDALTGYVRGGTTAGQRREVVQELERAIKQLAGNADNNETHFRHFSESEFGRLHDLISLRSMTLDAMMDKPTPMEVERLRKVNGTLYDLTLEIFENARRAWRMLRYTDYKVDDRYDYEVHGKAAFAYNDVAVASLENDGYYGSDFPYMLHLMPEIIGKDYKKMWLPYIIDVYEIFLSDEQEVMKELIANHLDDGTSWDEGVFRKKEFGDIIICHAIHALWDHQCYSGPDILRMENFEARIELQYEQEECEQRPYIEEYEQKRHWKK